ncbi:hypothetical protein M4I33_13145 [Clostridium sp. LY3-2]|uniref:hypothetical protein n=1 Tax=Clostridium sp. LY3-2 TaxID=2942482 RepID=UPI00215364CC|nr:hypothetical protein [Clostridium sp. LY3-2]MCR6515816.1 hypothetical protein [Clostridium sp. LY3-2]
MRKFFRRNRVILILLGLIILWLGAFSVLYLTLTSNTILKEWSVQLFMLAATLFSGLLTMIGVVYTINDANNKDETNRKEKNKKIALMIFLEMTHYFENLEQLVIINIDLAVKDKHKFLNLYDKYFNFVKLDVSFKEWIYDFILIDDRYIGEKLLKFYNTYINTIHENGLDFDNGVHNYTTYVKKVLSNQYNNNVSSLFDYATALTSVSTAFGFTNVNMYEDQMERAIELQSILKISNYNKFNDELKMILEYLESLCFSE